jgi:hypothetical protein
MLQAHLTRIIYEISNEKYLGINLLSTTAWTSVECAQYFRGNLGNAVEVRWWPEFEHYIPKRQYQNIIHIPLQWMLID